VTDGSVLEVRDLVVHYGKRVAVDGIDLRLRKGEIVALLGPNGAGKSTSLLAMAGAVVPSRGTIAVAGADLRTNPLAARAKVGFADQPPSLYEFFTVEEHLAFVGETRGHTDRAEQAPSLYKHFPDKRAVVGALLEEVLAESGVVLHDAVARPGRRTALESLLLAYRRYSLAHPHLYRLATSGPIDRDALPPGLEEWSGQPFFLATGEPHKAQALWSLAHGMVILEIDDRYADPSELDLTWQAAATAFT
jgi:ABC-type sugar transport system ATPase subunit